MNNMNILVKNGCIVEKCQGLTVRNQKTKKEG